MKRWLVVVAVAVIAWVGTCRAQETPKFTRTEDVVYGRKFGTALTLDVIKPEKQSGIGVLFMMSGGWYSNHDAINPAFFREYLNRGQTVFAVVHGSAPKFTIPEILPDIDRATRFVRMHAKDYGVDPNKLAISGGSAGGHLSLMQGARGTEGKPDAKDPVERFSSKIQCVACFYPPTDFLNYSEPGRNALKANELMQFWPSFAAKSRSDEDLEAAAKFASPVTYLTKDMPPTLITHGDKDTLVPIQQSELVMKQLESLKVPHKLIVKPGAGHGWAGLDKDIGAFGDWIDEHLKK